MTRFWLKKRGTKLYSPATVHRGTILVEDQILCVRQEIKSCYPGERVRGQYWDSGSILQIQIFQKGWITTGNLVVFATTIIFLILAFLQVYLRLEREVINTPIPPTPTITATPRDYKYLIRMFSQGREKEFLCCDYRVPKVEGKTAIRGIGCLHQTEVFTITDIEWFTIQVQE